MLIAHPLGIVVLIGVVLAVALVLSALVVRGLERLGITRMEWRGRWISVVALGLFAVLLLLAWFFV